MDSRLRKNDKMGKGKRKKGNEILTVVLPEVDSLRMTRWEKREASVN
jgi:hypothetical protein